MGSFAKEKCGGRQSAATQRAAIAPRSLTHYLGSIFPVCVDMRQFFRSERANSAWISGIGARQQKCSLLAAFRPCRSGVTAGVPAQAPAVNGGQCCRDPRNGLPRTSTQDACAARGRRVVSAPPERAGDGSPAFSILDPPCAAWAATSGRILTVPPGNGPGSGAGVSPVSAGVPPGMCLPPPYSRSFFVVTFVETFVGDCTGRQRLRQRLRQRRWLQCGR